MNYEYEVRGNYGYGYETVFTAETKGEALSILRDYRANELGTPFTIRKVRAN